MRGAGPRERDGGEVLNNEDPDNAHSGAAVRARSEAGGGWMGWCVEVVDLVPLEVLLGRAAVNGNRKFPDGRELARSLISGVTGCEVKVAAIQRHWRKEWRERTRGSDRIGEPHVRGRLGVAQAVVTDPSSGSGGRRVGEDPVHAIGHIGGADEDRGATGLVVAQGS